MEDLMEEAGVGKTKALESLRELVNQGALVWVGKSQNDPHQYYRPIDEA